MNKDQAFERIKKYLQQAKFENGREAAQVLKQVQAMARDYCGLNVDAALTIKIPLASSCWQFYLLEACGLILGVHGYMLHSYDLTTKKNQATYHFHGIAPGPELALIIYKYILRRIRATRRLNRTLRGEEFYMQWLAAFWSELKVLKLIS